MAKLLYLCSFVPYLTLQNMGFDMEGSYDEYIEPDSNSRLSGNLCGFVKYCERADFSRFDGVIFTNCCNSTQRLYDYVKYKYPSLFSYLLEVPRNDIEDISFQNMLYALKKRFKLQGNKQTLKLSLLENRNADILVIASSLHIEYADKLKEIFSDYILSFETCQSIPRGDLILNKTKADISCPRMADFFEYIHDKLKNVKGVIYITTQKCDHIMFAYPQIKAMCNELNIKCLLLEEEYTNNISERSKIRYEAFLECLERKMI